MQTVSAQLFCAALMLNESRQWCGLLISVIVWCACVKQVFQPKIMPFDLAESHWKFHIFFSHWSLQFGAVRTTHDVFDLEQDLRENYIAGRMPGSDKLRDTFYSRVRGALEVCKSVCQTVRRLLGRSVSWSICQSINPKRIWVK